MRGNSLKGYGKEHELKKNRPFLFLSLFLLSAFLLMGSCDKTGEIFKSTALKPEEPNQAYPALQEQTMHNRSAVLENGNNWVQGVPGFGVNAFAALAGCYRLLDPEGEPKSTIDENNAKGSFYVFVTGELLYFSSNWLQVANGTMQAYQLSGEDGFVEAVVLEDNKGIFRTAVFQFPQGLDYCGMTIGSLNQMLPVWTSRFLYFVSQADTRGELSLPAVVEF